MAMRKQSYLIYQIIFVLGTMILTACGESYTNDYALTPSATDSSSDRPRPQISLTPFATNTPSIDHENVTLTPTHTIKPTLDIANYTNIWVRYTDSRFGISIEYPLIYNEKPYYGICEPVESRDGVAFGEKSQVFVHQTLGTSLDEHIQSFIARYPPERKFKVESQKSMLINGQPATTIKYKLGENSTIREFIFIMAPESNLIYTFSFIGGSACDVPEIGVSEYTVFEHAIETFYFER
jgi:hypothetical protein